MMLSQVDSSRIKGFSFDQNPLASGRECNEEGSLERTMMLSSSAESILRARNCTSCCRQIRPVLAFPPSSSTYSVAVTCNRMKAFNLKSPCFSEVFCCNRRANVLSRSNRLSNGSNESQRPRYSSLGVPGWKTFQQHPVSCVGSVSSMQKNSQQEGVKNELMQAQFVHWFREGSPYIQGHRSSTFVIVLPGEVTVDNVKMDGILQDILLLHGLGVKLVIIPGTHVHIDELLRERGHKPQYSGAYRITDAEALAASMEAAGRVRVAIEAKLSRAPSIPILRRHGDNDRWHEVSIASGNFLAAKRRGVVNGVDFCATGEVKRLDIARIQERLDNNCIVMLTNLGYSTTGEVLNCNTYEVATACAIALQADKMLCLLDGPVLDEDRRVLRFMTLQEADSLIRGCASQSSTAADYVKLVTGSSYAQSQGSRIGSKNGDYTSGTMNASHRKLGSDGSALNSRIVQKMNGAGFAVGGKERLSRMNSYLIELTAAVFVCRNGVRRVHLLDGNVEGVLLLELYTRDGVGMMVSNDMYEGTRTAVHADVQSIMELLRPLEESGVLVNRPREQLEQEFQNYIVVERDSSIIACAALIQYPDDKCGEVAAFAVSPECRGHGQGDALLDYIEKRAAGLKMERLFLLTTRTADWFVHHGFAPCTVDRVPRVRQEKIDYTRGAKYYEKILDQSSEYRAPRR